MRLPAHLVVDLDTDTLQVEISSADSDGGVVVLSLDLKPLSAADKRRLRHVRDPQRVQRASAGRPA